MLKLADLRKTTRKGADDIRNVYPRLLRDSSLRPRIELAIRYLDGMVGQPRTALDAEVVIRLFGDHKVARCIVACLGATYRHRTQTFTDVLAPDRVACLAEHDIRTPSDLRLWLYTEVAARYPGFVDASERPTCLTEAGNKLGLSVEEIESLLTLDAPGNAILLRVGPVPTPEEVQARLNYETVGALLANAPQVRLALTRKPPQGDAMRALCEAFSVRAEFGPRELVLRGQQDVFDGWARHGARLVRVLSLLLACGLPARSGEAMIVAPMGDTWRYRLDAEALADLGARAQSLFDPRVVLAALDAREKLFTQVVAQRRAGEAREWQVRRTVDPLIVGGEIVPMLGFCQRGNDRVALFAPPLDDAAAARLAVVEQRAPLLALQPEEDGVDVGAPRVTTLPIGGNGRDAAVALPEVLARATQANAERDAETRLATLLDEARTTGVLTEGSLAHRLGCDEEELPERLAASPLAEAVAERDLRYVEGFGLCTQAVLERARAASNDVASLRGSPAVGTAWLLRVLGRKLREVTGASEGIECLIAYLGAA